MKKLDKIELNTAKSLSDEEIKIANILNFFSEKIKYPLLDVGSGSWKISSIAFENNEVIHLDTLEFSDSDFKLPSNHKRISWDFFEYQNKDKIKSLLFCHSLQYIDDKGIDKVINKIEEINPEYILLVINKNDGIVWASLKFFEKNQWHENWERYFSEFPWKNFSLIEESDVTWTFFCKTTKEATTTICRLLLDTIISNEQEEKIINFLEENKINWSFEVNQDIFLYQNKNIRNG